MKCYDSMVWDKISVRENRRVEVVAVTCLHIRGDSLLHIGVSDFWLGMTLRLKVYELPFHSPDFAPTDFRFLWLLKRFATVFCVCSIKCTGSRDIMVVILWINTPRNRMFDFWNRTSKFFFSKASRLALGPTIFPTQWVSRFFPGGKRPGCELDNLRLRNAEVKNVWSYTSISRMLLRSAQEH